MCQEALHLLRSADYATQRHCRLGRKFGAFISHYWVLLIRARSAKIRRACWGSQSLAPGYSYAGLMDSHCSLQLIMIDSKSEIAHFRKPVNATAHTADTITANP